MVFTFDQIFGKQFPNDIITKKTFQQNLIKFCQVFFYSRLKHAKILKNKKKKKCRLNHQVSLSVNQERIVMSKINCQKLLKL